jgi:transcription antitermination factor NusG
MGEACSDVTSLKLVALPKQYAPAWFAVQAAYRCERRVAQALTSKGFTTYLPLLREVHQWTDRKKIVEVPAFTGYVFVHCAPNLHNRIRVLETVGVVRMLGSNHEPSPVSEIEIDAVRRMLSSGAACDRCDPLLPGDMVQVKRGPLAGLEGRLVRTKGGMRLVVVITSFAQAISAELSQSDVELASGPSVESHFDRQISSLAS